MIGRTLGHYRIEKELGAGGMGVVYLARDTNLRRNVAVKMVGADPDPSTGDSPPDDALRSGLLREARAASALNHPNICTIHEIGEAESGAYIVMEHVEGDPLRRLIPPGGLPPETVFTYGVQIADALAHAHARGIIHRDLKALNVIVTPDQRVKVLDFGLAKRLPGVSAGGDETRSLASVDPSGGVAGTLHYLPPEVLRGEPATPDADLWAAGILLFEMATGHLPFRGKTHFELSSSILKDPLPPLGTNVPAALGLVIQRSLDKEPGQRYGSAGELRAALEAARGAPAAGPVSATRPSAEGKIRGLAVLPLKNLSGDPSQDYFADGITEAITASIAQLGTLRVISRTSAMRYKGTTKTLPEIAHELNVDGIVEGSILRSGQRVRISAQLLHAVTDRHLWAGSFDRDLHDLLELQDDVARAVVREIQETVAGRAAGRAVSRRVDPEVHEANLKGRFFLGKRDTEGLTKGIECFRQAIEKDPTFATAYAGMAECYNVLGFQGAFGPEDTFARAEAAARKALEIDESSAEAHCSLGYATIHFRWDWNRAREHYQHALDLNANYATAHHWYAFYLAGLGRRDEALEHMAEARRLDPLSLILGAGTGWLLYLFREYDEAIELCRKSLELDPEFWVGRYVMGDVYTQKSMFPEALRELEHILHRVGDHPAMLASKGCALAMSGRADEARGIVSAMDEMSGRRYVKPAEIAKVLTALGDRGEALERLEQAFREGGNGLNYLRGDPAFDSLRGNPRFDDLLRRVYGNSA